MGKERVWRTDLEERFGLATSKYDERIVSFR